MLGPRGVRRRLRVGSWRRLWGRRTKLAPHPPRGEAPHPEEAVRADHQAQRDDDTAPVLGDRVYEALMPRFPGHPVIDSREPPFHWGRALTQNCGHQPRHGKPRWFRTWWPCSNRSIGGNLNLANLYLANTIGFSQFYTRI